MDRAMVLILGVTGSGKGKLAFSLAESMGGEIISIDSMKVYRRMDIGTAKPSRELQERVNYHLIDVVEPSESFSVGRFMELGYDAIEQIRGRNRPVVAVGGTALYIKAMLYGLFEGPGSDEKIRGELRERERREGLKGLYRQLEELDPAAAENIHPNDRKRIIRALEVYLLTGECISGLQQQFDAERPVHKWKIIGLRRERAVENSRINARVKRMIDAGLVDEVNTLLAEDKQLSRQASCAIGYAEIIEHLAGKMSLEESVEMIKKNTRRLAKNQRTWFKSFRDVNWLDIGTGESEEEIFGRANGLVDG